MYIYTPFKLVVFALLFLELYVSHPFSQDTEQANITQAEQHQAGLLQRVSLAFHMKSYRYFITSKPIVLKNSTFIRQMKKKNRKRKEKKNIEEEMLGCLNI